MAEKPEAYLGRANFVLDEDLYIFIKLPPNAITPAAGIIAEISEAFTALVIDQQEVTLVFPEDALQQFEKRLSGATRNDQRYRLITIDVILPPDLSGFMAFISSALAKHGIIIMPFAAYSRDLILVPDHQSEEALRILEALKATL